MSPDMIARLVMVGIQVASRLLEKKLGKSLDEMSNAEINRLTKKAYLRFYMRPSFLLRSLLGVRSLRELKRKAFALLAMVFMQRGKTRLNTRFRAFQENPRKLVRKYRPVSGAKGTAGNGQHADEKADVRQEVG